MEVDEEEDADKLLDPVTMPDTSLLTPEVCLTTPSEEDGRKEIYETQPTPTEDTEVITGDKPVPLEAVLQASIIDNEGNIDKSNSSTIAIRDHPYTLPPDTVQDDSDDLEIISETPPTKKKSLKVCSFKQFIVVSK